MDEPHGPRMCVGARLRPRHRSREKPYVRSCGLWMWRCVSRHSTSAIGRTCPGQAVIRMILCRRPRVGQQEHQPLGSNVSESPISIRLHLVGRRSFARRLQTGGLRQGHPALHRPAASGLRSGAHQGGGAGRIRREAEGGLNPEPFVLRKAGQSFANVSPLDMRKLMGDQDNIAQNLWSSVVHDTLVLQFRKVIFLGDPLFLGG